jgi:hypothetical protein
MWLHSDCFCTEEEDNKRGRWVGDGPAGPKEGWRCPIQNIGDFKIAPGQRSRQGGVLRTYSKTSVSYSKQYSKFPNIIVLVLIQNKKRARGYL